MLEFMPWQKGLQGYGRADLTSDIRHISPVEPLYLGPGRPVDYSYYSVQYTDFLPYIVLCVTSVTVVHMITRHSHVIEVFTALGVALGSFGFRVR
jgi:hypothetical protein